MRAFVLTGLLVAVLGCTQPPGGSSGSSSGAMTGGSSSSSSHVGSTSHASSGATSTAGSSSGGVSVGWKPTTVPWTPDCQGCSTVYEAETTPGGNKLRIQSNSQVDDPVAQWAECVDEALACVRAGGGAPALVGCVASAGKCPQACRDMYAAQVAPVVGQPAEEQRVYQALFVARGGACRPTRDTAGVMP